ncbi:hypothetical protein ACROYT_G020414 [Oculina patagonica]
MVPNYLPSISAAVGGYMPEKFIWRVGIALHCLPPIFISPTIFYKHYKETQSGRRYNLTTWWFWPLNVINCILQVVENGALLTLTYVSSTDNLVYTLFALAEYCTVVSIIVFHWYCSWRIQLTVNVESLDLSFHKLNLEVHLACTLSSVFSYQ